MFVNREKEKIRLGRALAKDQTQLIVLYGRRRCGKSTLLREVLKSGSVTG
jgi:AAA+ ATPase superfamily predicted ATPase